MLYSSKRFYNKPLPCFGKRCILQHHVENSRAGRQVVAGDQKEMRTVRYGESYYICIRELYPIYAVVFVVFSIFHGHWHNCKQAGHVSLWSRMLDEKRVCPGGAGLNLNTSSTNRTMIWEEKTWTYRLGRPP